MKRNNSRQALCLLAFLLIFLASCAKHEAISPVAAEAPTEEVLTEAKQVVPQPPEISPLPVRYQKATYFTQDEKTSDITDKTTDEYELKVGADIFTRDKPQTLFDVMNILADLKGMNISWVTYR